MSYTYTSIFSYPLLLSSKLIVIVSKSSIFIYYKEFPNIFSVVRSQPQQRKKLLVAEQPAAPAELTEAATAPAKEPAGPKEGTTFTLHEMSPPQIGGGI